MKDEKCPTCPNYGKGYCDCGQSRSKGKEPIFQIFLFGVTIGALIMTLIDKYIL